MTEFTLDSADRFRRAVGDLVRAVRATEDAPEGQLETLGFLVRDGAQSIAELARRRRIRHQSMSSTVAELETRGWVTRSPDPRDKRSVIVEVSAEGTAVIEESRRTRSSAILRAAEQTFSPDELAVLAHAPDLFDKLGAAIIANYSRDLSNGASKESPL